MPASDCWRAGTSGTFRTRLGRRNPLRFGETRVADGEEVDLRCRWVVDAMGRRRFLQRKLGSERRSKGDSAAPPGSGLTTGSMSPISFPKRTATGTSALRKTVIHSTNHLVGYGYWVWLIPLSNGGTSIGIVTREDIHPPAEYRTYELAMEWLQKHEPVLAERTYRIGSPLDFRWIHKYSYSSQKAILC